MVLDEPEHVLRLQALRIYEMRNAELRKDPESTIARRIRRTSADCKHRRSKGQAPFQRRRRSAFLGGTRLTIINN
jgi:hypothetical protein